MDDDLRQTFRISVWRPWLLALALLAIPLLIAAGVAVANGQPQGLAGLLVGLLVVGSLLWLVIGLAVRTSRWDVDPEGIGGPDNWHIYRWVRWDEIESLSRLPVPGYPFVWVNTAYRRKLFWVPLFLTDMRGFGRAVARYAGPHHPLCRCLERRRR